MRVLHGPINIGNHPWVLSRHERKLGLDSELVVSYGSGWLNYPADRILVRAGEPAWRTCVRRCWFGMTAACRYDVLHYYFGRTFLPYYHPRLPASLHHFDLMLGRLAGRKRFMTLQGCDVRLSDLSAQRNRVSMCQQGHCPLVPECRASQDAERRRLIDQILPSFHRVFVLNPELAHFVPGAVFMPYANVDVEAIDPVPPRTDGPITLLHAPTSDGIKGTRFVLEAVENLKKRWPIRMLLVRGMTHADALQVYRQADFVIDQLLAGWYGGFAVETMALGKPVGCYIRDEDLIHIPAAMRDDLPLLRLHPQTLEQDLEEVLARRAEWPAWGRRCRQFVLRWHQPGRLAQAMVRAYRDPQSRFYLEGESTSCAA